MDLLKPADDDHAGAALKPYLVIHYSRSGITRLVAGQIAEACDADLDAITDLSSRRGVAGYVRSVYEAVARKTPVVSMPGKSAGDYRLTVLGTPVWAGKVSAPMRSYLLKNSGSLHRVAAFCTMGGAGGDKVLDEIAALCGKPLIARMVVTDAEIQQGRHLEKIAGFCRAISTQMH